MGLCWKGAGRIRADKVFHTYLESPYHLPCNKKFPSYRADGIWKAHYRAPPEWAATLLDNPLYHLTTFCNFWYCSASSNIIWHFNFSTIFDIIWQYLTVSDGLDFTWRHATLFDHGVIVKLCHICQEMLRSDHSPSQRSHYSLVALSYVCSI